MNPPTPLNRRELLGRLALGSAALASPLLWTPGVFAEELTRTPPQGEGPFYPDKLPLDTDNDLIVINDSVDPSVGKITYLSGHVLDEKGSPLRNAVVEIWQCDANGVYLHSRSANGKNRDKNFQGFGRFLTDSKGRYFFRTIKPVSYPGRTPHIHVIVKKGKKRLLTTQLYVAGEKKKNENDRIYMSVKDPELRKLITLPYKPIKGSKIGEHEASVDLVVGVTPEDEKREA